MRAILPTQPVFWRRRRRESAEVLAGGSPAGASAAGRPPFPPSPEPVGKATARAPGACAAGSPNRQGCGGDRRLGGRARRPSATRPGRRGGAARGRPCASGLAGRTEGPSRSTCELPATRPSDPARALSGPDEACPKSALLPPTTPSRAGKPSVSLRSAASGPARPAADSAQPTLLDAGCPHMIAALFADRWKRWRALRLADAAARRAVRLLGGSRARAARARRLHRLSGISAVLLGGEEGKRRLQKSGETKGRRPGTSTKLGTVEAAVRRADRLASLETAVRKGGLGP